MISQRYGMDENMPHLCRIQLWEKDWEKMLSCWRFCGNKDVFWQVVMDHILSAPLIATRSVWINTKGFSSLEPLRMLELTLTKAGRFNKCLTNLYSPCQVLRTERWMTVICEKLSFLTLVMEIKNRCLNENKRKDPAMSSPTEESDNLVKQRATIQIEWHLFDILCAIWYTCFHRTFSFKIYYLLATLNPACSFSMSGRLFKSLRWCAVLVVRCH